MNEYDQIKLLMIKKENDLTMFPAFHQMKQLVEKTELEHPEMDGSQLLRTMEKQLSIILLDLQSQKAEFYQTSMDNLLLSLSRLEGRSDEQAFMHMVAKDIQAHIETIKLENPDVTPDKIFDALSESGALKTLVSVLEQRLSYAKEYTKQLISEKSELQRQTRKIHIRSALVTLFVAAFGSCVVFPFQHMSLPALAIALFFDVCGALLYYAYLRRSYRRRLAKALKDITLSEQPFKSTP